MKNTFLGKVTESYLHSLDMALVNISMALQIYTHAGDVLTLLGRGGAESQCFEVI